MKSNGRSTFNLFGHIAQMFHKAKHHNDVDTTNKARTSGNAYGHRSAPILSKSWFGRNKFRPGNASQFTGKQLRDLEAANQS